ncbi:hypothetical protein HUJ05_000803 [Dendroctonus ponderosae]|nr:hypothetical protein HUJ05_000803 [Dendroctonus ponderosae]
MAINIDDIERNYRSDDTEEIVSTDNPTSPFPAPTPKLVSPRSPVPLHRQASPFPLESINSRRVNYQPVTDRLRTIGVTLHLYQYLQLLVNGH